MCPKGTDERCVMGCFLEMGQAIWELLEGDVEAMRVSMRKGKRMNCRIIWSKSLSVILGEIENEKTVFTPLRLLLFDEPLRKMPDRVAVRHLSCLVKPCIVMPFAMFCTTKHA